jgi:hypothetical protein
LVPSEAVAVTNQRELRIGNASSNEVGVEVGDHAADPGVLAGHGAGFDDDDGDVRHRVNCCPGREGREDGEKRRPKHCTFSVFIMF